MEWTTNTPTEPGYYWVYVRPRWEDKPEVFCVEVSIFEGKPSFAFPVGGYECEEEIYARDVTHWLGPIPKPEPPQ